jgi:DNA modification methylase
MDFQSGKIRVIVSKGSIFGFGMNFQNCHQVVFVGMSHSYEQYYQSIRRCWRFGQTETVNAYLVYDWAEGAVIENIRRKDTDATVMADAMVEIMKANTLEQLKQVQRNVAPYVETVTSGDAWQAYQGDCVEGVKRLDDNSVHYSIFSPPFASLYTYSNSDRDMGNCKTGDEFAAHFAYLIKELHRVIMPGRLVSFHCMNLPSSKTRDGVIGLKDFRGQMIALFEAQGFVFHSEVCIWKDPVTAMQRTKAIGLLHKQVVKDSAMSRQGIPDYLVTMRKRGDNTEPVAGKLADFAGEDGPRVTSDDTRNSINIWQRYASPVWMDINPSDTLQFRNARDNDDERHICPLQLDVIRRGIQLWSNPGDVVLSPFMGIGSEGHVALEMGRGFVGFELKPSYYECAVKNLAAAAKGTDQHSLFAEATA